MLREGLAKLAHEQWSGWMEYLFTKGIDHTDGSFTIDKEHTLRWKRQMRIPYEKLSEEEKDSDRKEADKFIEELRKAI